MSKESKKSMQNAQNVEAPIPMAEATGVEAFVRIYSHHAEYLRQVQAASSPSNPALAASNSSSAFLLPHVK